MYNMKRWFCVLAFVACVVSAYSQKDSTFRKTGFNMGALPVVSYDSDFGFQYGALTNLYWYGDGSSYPKYKHSLYLEGSRFVSGSYILRAYYDAPDLLGKVRLTADLTCMHELNADFFGFNGREAIFNKEFEDEASKLYRSKFYYNYDQKMTRGMVNFRSAFSDKGRFFWLAGLNLLNMELGSMDRSKIDKEVPDVPSLYDEYVKWGVIDENEADGGFNAQLNVGVSFDSRDRESCPTKGMWTEVLLLYNPSITSSNDADYAKITVYHRQYFNLYAKRLTLAYRLGWQHKLWGKTPYYLLQNWNTTVLTGASSTGLGGARSVRGVRRNRVIADGEVMANVELRWKFVEFMLFKQRIALATNIFADGGMVTQEYDVNLDNVPESELERCFDLDGDKPHVSAGAGLKISYNDNFTFSVDYGKALNEQDGTQGFYVGMNYLF